MKKTRLLSIVLAVVMCASFFGFGLNTAKKAYADTAWELHYWNFDDSLNDAAGAYNLVGDAAYADGKNGKALDVGSLDTTPKTEMLTCDTVTGFTMGAWIYLNSTAKDWNIIMSKGNTNGGDADRFQMHIGMASEKLGGGRLLVYSPATRGNGYPDTEQDSFGTENVVPFETWTFVTTTWNGNVARVFMNGVKIFEVEIGGELDTSLAQYHNVRIGALNDGATFKFDGRIDDAFYANYAMTEADVAAAYAQDGAATLKAWADGSKSFTPDAMKEREPVIVDPPEVITKADGLVFYWSFDDTFNDISHKELDFDFEDMCPSFTEGKNGSAVLLEDASICTDTLPTDLDLTEFTLSYWFRWDGIAAGTLPYYILSALGDKAYDYHLEIYLRSEDCETGSLCIYNPGDYAVNELAQIVPGEFNHIVMTNSLTEGIKVYVNGTLAAKRSKPVNISTMTDSETERFTLGALQDYSLVCYGAYDEVVLADFAFSEELVGELYSDPAKAQADIKALAEGYYPEGYARATPKPTAAPTEVPTEAPATEVPTEAPATAVPATAKPSADKDTASSNGSIVTVIIIVAAVLVIGIVAAILVILKKKKK